MNVLSLVNLKLPDNSLNRYLLKAINNRNYELLFIVQHLLYVRRKIEYPRPSKSVISRTIAFCKEHLAFCKAVLKRFTQSIYLSDRDYHFARQAIEVKKFLIPRLEELLYIRELLSIGAIYLEREESNDLNQVEILKQEELIIEFSHTLDNEQKRKHYVNLKTILNSILLEGRYVGEQSQIIIKDASHIKVVSDLLINSLNCNAKGKHIVWFRLDIEHHLNHVQKKLRTDVLKVCDTYMKLIEPIPELVHSARFQIVFVLGIKCMINIELERERLRKVITKLSAHYKKHKRNLHDAFHLITKYESYFLKNPTEDNYIILKKYIYQRLDNPEGLTDDTKKSLIDCSARVNKHYNTLKAKRT